MNDGLESGLTCDVPGCEEGWMGVDESDAEGWVEVSLNAIDESREPFEGHMCPGHSVAIDATLKFIELRRAE